MCFTVTCITSFTLFQQLIVLLQCFSDYSDLKADKKRMDHFTSLCVVLYEFLKDISLPNTVELMGIYGRVRWTGHYIKYRAIKNTTSAIWMN